MDPMTDVNSWSEQRREEALRQARRRSMAKQGKGERNHPLQTPWSRPRFGRCPGPLPPIYSYVKPRSYLPLPSTTEIT